MDALFRHRPARLAALGCAAAIVASLSAAALASTAAAPAAGAVPRQAAAPSHPSRVFLPTGERADLRWTGNRPQVVQRDGSPTTVTTVGDDVYAIPVEAEPYIGSALDRSLFDVTQLAAKEGPDAAGQIPVSLGFGGSAVSVPGVRITSQASQSAPLIAALIARSGRTLSDASWIYAHRGAFNDVVGGSNGYCGGDYLCTRQAGLRRADGHRYATRRRGALSSGRLPRMRRLGQNQPSTCEEG